jgi:hypothetical protein
VTRERPKRPRAGDPVRRKPAPGLKAAKRDGRGPREAPVHRSRAEPVTPEPELEHCDVPPDSAHSELTLSEQRSASTPQRAPGLVTDEPGRANAVGALKGQQSSRRQLAPHAVDRTRVEPVGVKPDLEGGDPSAGGEPAGSERQDANGHRDAGDGEATHERTFRHAPGRSSPVEPPGGHGYNPPAAFPGSSIGRASGC